jgi:hypothetical protein
MQQAEIANAREFDEAFAHPLIPSRKREGRIVQPCPVHRDREEEMDGQSSARPNAIALPGRGYDEKWCLDSPGRSAQ